MSPPSCVWFWNKSRGNASGLLEDNRWLRGGGGETRAQDFVLYSLINAVVIFWVDSGVGTVGSFCHCGRFAPLRTPRGLSRPRSESNTHAPHALFNRTWVGRFVDASSDGPPNEIRAKGAETCGIDGMSSSCARPFGPLDDSRLEAGRVGRRVIKEGAVLARRRSTPCQPC